MISLRRLRRRHIPTQCVAAFWLAFYTIAALRSVIPGACETQACVLERAEAAQAVSEAHACCSAIENGEPRVSAPHAEHEPHCAMCTLMTAAVDPAAAINAYPNPAPEETHRIRHILAPQHAQHDPAAPRAPPAPYSIAV